LWAGQIVAGVFFIFVGINHFIVPEGLPGFMSWMYDLSTTMHVISGTAELLGGLGLILPAVTRIQPQLVPLAATGLAVVMLGAIVYHIGRSEFASVGSNVVWLLVTGFIAYGRFRLAPIEPKGAATTA
jgi:VIT1/CCC1 family predicted Fe2+/Mn2+ transporter